MQDKYCDEVVELHRFIRSWLAGSIEQSKQIFASFEAALAEEFVIIEPSGEIVPRVELLQGFWNAHGVMPQSFEIEIKNTQVRILDDSLGLVTYEEWQTGIEKTARVSSVLLRKTDSGLRWLYLHETWMSVEQIENE